VGVEVYRGAISDDDVRLAARAAWDCVARALLAGAARGRLEKRYVSVLYPHPFLDGLLERLPVQGRTEPFKHPQTLCVFPGTEDPFQPHTDVVESSSRGYELDTVVGVYLTAADADDGCLRVWKDDGEPTPIPVEPGDVVAFTADVRHAAGPNLGVQPRLAVYYRFVRDAP
jgi:hypothetical protein